MPLDTDQKPLELTSEPPPAEAGNSPAAAPASAPPPRPAATPATIDRARRYLKKFDPIPGGPQGRQKYIKAMATVGAGFDLNDDELFGLAQNDFNPRCTPPKTDAELLQIVAVAQALPSPKPRGWLRDANLAPRETYEATSAGFVAIRCGAKDKREDVLLTNFTARIVEERITEHEDGDHVEYELEVTLQGDVKRVRLSAAEFRGMDWILDRLGSGAIIFPGFQAKDRVLAAIQLAYPKPTQRRVHCHTGWCEHNGQWTFRTNGGGITAVEYWKMPVCDLTRIWPKDGVLEVGLGQTVMSRGQIGQSIDLDMDLPVDLAGYALPAPPPADELRKAVRGVWNFVNMGPVTLTLPLFAAVWRAPLGDNRSTVFLVGSTGTRKSTLAALALNFFGPTFENHRLPANWSSTANALLELAHRTKDVLLVIDEFKPEGSDHDVTRLNSKADQVLRAVSNQSSRQRLSASGGVRSTHLPQGLVIATGEECPSGESLLGRILTVDVAGDDIDMTKLTECQNDARNGTYAVAMSGYIAWLAHRYGAVKRTLEADIRELTKKAAAVVRGHAQAPRVVADLMIGMVYFLEYIVDIGDCPWPLVKRIEAQLWDALVAAANKHAEESSRSDPVERFRDLVDTAMATGMAHVAGHLGEEPINSSAWGWRENQPRGNCIGWLYLNQLYFDVGAALLAAQRVVPAAGQGLGVSERTLVTLLDQRGWLASKESYRGVRTIRKTLGGKRRTVLHVQLDKFFSPPREEDTTMMEDGRQIVEVDGYRRVLIWGNVEGYLTPQLVEPNDEESSPTAPYVWHFLDGFSRKIWVDDTPMNVTLTIKGGDVLVECTSTVPDTEGLALRAV